VPASSSRTGRLLHEIIHPKNRSTRSAKKAIVPSVPVDDTEQSAEARLDALPAEAGCELGKYHLIAELARGGMGVVYLAVLRGLQGFHKLVVLKELRKELLDNEASVEMFMAEARLAARLNHPNIVHTIEVGADGGRLFIAMEYLDGQPLQQLVRRARKCATSLPLPVHLGILLEVLAALEYAHELTDFSGTPLGIVHRDVSPPNVFVTYEGHIKLVDFGISTTVGEMEEQRVGVVAGKMRYMAPEQARGERADRRADLFAIGVLLWEAAVGRRPWDGQADLAVLQSLSSGAVPCVLEACPEIDPDLAAIVDRAMRVVPEERYATALEMREDLERYIRARRILLPNARSLSAIVSQLFAEDRERRRGLIDAQLSAMREEDPPDSGRLVAGRLEMPAPSFGLSAQTSLCATTLSSSPPAEEMPVASSTPPSVSRSVSPPGSRSSSMWPVGIALGIMATLALAAVAGHRLHLVAKGTAAVGAFANAPVVLPPVSAPPVESASTAPTASIHGASSTSHVVVTASPSSAQLYVDDGPVSNPYIADQVRNWVAHRVRVEAAGYETKTRVFTFLEDTDIQIDLARKTPAPVASHAPPPPPAPRPDCDPPYTLDSVTGKKHWRLECL
jgi:serine/threonine protein kinase